MTGCGLALISAITVLSASIPAHAEDSVDARIARLEQEIALLKREREVEKEKADAAAAKEALVEYGPKGLAITSPDKRYSLKMRGYVQADARSFFDDGETNNTDQFLLRTARPVFDATFDKDFAARLMFDFGSGQTRLVDAYADYKPFSFFNVRLGKFKVPLGLERWQSEQELSFVERGMTTNLVPNRDIGLQFYGEILPQTLEYQVALTNGVADLGDSSGDGDGPKEVSARVFAQPFRNAEMVALQGVGVGVAGSYGGRDGSASNTGLTEGYRTPGQARFFSYRAGATDAAFADGTAWRLNPQAWYYYGPLGILGEYVESSQEVRRGGAVETLEHDAWWVAASYVLTGEDAAFDGVKPHDYFSLERGEWGAFELTARYGELRIDDAAFPLFADPARSASAAYDATLGLNWYLNHNLKFNVDYSHTTFDGGAAAGTDRETEKVLMTRAQFRF